MGGLSLDRHFYLLMKHGQQSLTIVRELRKRRLFRRKIPLYKTFIHRYHHSLGLLDLGLSPQYHWTDQNVSLRLIKWAVFRTYDQCSWPILCCCFWSGEEKDFLVFQEGQFLLANTGFRVFSGDCKVFCFEIQHIKWQQGNVNRCK